MKRSCALKGSANDPRGSQILAGDHWRNPWCDDRCCSHLFFTENMRVSNRLPLLLPSMPLRPIRKGQRQMRLSTLSMLLLCVLSLAACQTNAPPSCAGFQRITVKPATAVYLAGNDVLAGQGIASHNAFGKTRKCW
jgi:hypothetical protein